MFYQLKLYYKILAKLQSRKMLARKIGKFCNNLHYEKAQKG